MFITLVLLIIIAIAGVVWLAPAEERLGRARDEFYREVLVRFFGYCRRRFLKNREQKKLIAVAETPDFAESRAEELLLQLSKYYREPVLPMSRYCEAFRSWFTAIEAADKEDVANPESEVRRFPWGEYVPQILLAIAKSSFLSRLLYGGQAARTQRCPLHRGRWQGLHTERRDYRTYERWIAQVRAEGREPGAIVVALAANKTPCECWDGLETSGWIPQGTRPFVKEGGSK